MKWQTKLVLLLLPLALLAPLWLQGPDHQPIMTADEWFDASDRLNTLAMTTPGAGGLPESGPDGGVGRDGAFADTYYQWQDESGVWHFSDQPPAHLAELLQPQPLPDPANAIGAPLAFEPVGGGTRGSISPGFDSSIDAQLPAGVSREAIETLLDEAHEKRMGEER